MKYWLDTEFIEDGKTIDLISIGIVAEDGREYYAINTEFDSRKASQWVIDNVLKHLPPTPTYVNLSDPSTKPSDIEAFKAWRNRKAILKDVLNFCSPEIYGEPEFWGYYADYDWVGFCQLFGTMMDLPNGFPMYCRDVKQLCDDLGNPRLPEQTSTEHHALEDARWTKQAWEFLQEIKQND